MTTASGGSTRSAAGSGTLQYYSSRRHGSTPTTGRRACWWGWCPNWSTRSPRSPAPTASGSRPAACQPQAAGRALMPRTLPRSAAAPAAATAVGSLPRCSPGRGARGCFDPTPTSLQGRSPSRPGEWIFSGGPLRSSPGPLPGRRLPAWPASAAPAERPFAPTCARTPCHRKRSCCVAWSCSASPPRQSSREGAARRLMGAAPH